MIVLWELEADHVNVIKWIQSHTRIILMKLMFKIQLCREVEKHIHRLCGIFHLADRIYVLIKWSLNVFLLTISWTFCGGPDDMKRRWASRNYYQCSLQPHKVRLALWKHALNLIVNEETRVPLSHPHPVPSPAHCLRPQPISKVPLVFPGIDPTEARNEGLWLAAVRPVPCQCQCSGSRCQDRMCARSQPYNLWRILLPTHCKWCSCHRHSTVSRIHLLYWHPLIKSKMSIYFNTKQYYTIDPTSNIEIKKLNWNMFDIYSHNGCSETYYWHL